MKEKSTAPWYKSSAIFLGTAVGKWWRGLRIGLPGIWLMALYHSTVEVPTSPPRSLGSARQVPGNS